jgi:hypothetical protein
LPAPLDEDSFGTLKTLEAELDREIARRKRGR